MDKTEWQIGLNQVIVVYVSVDTSEEVDPMIFFADIADDAKQYAGQGFRISAMTGLPLRHTAVFMGRDGSGYQSKACVTVVYEGPSIAAP